MNSASSSEPKVYPAGGTAIRLPVSRALVFIRKESFFFIVLAVTVILSFFSMPHVSAIHWNVIATLFALMLVCSAFTECRLLDWIAVRALGTFQTPRKLGLAMIAATGALAMVVTNDVALLTVVPLTLIMAKMSGKDPFLLIILETLSANLFSALTPFGNPQNLYLYDYYGIPAGEFFRMMLPFGLAGAALLVAVNGLFNKGDVYKTKQKKPDFQNGKLLFGATAAFLLIILSVLRVADYRIALAATLLIFFVLARRMFIKVDYFLLGTFILFFLFTDSLIGIEAVRDGFVRFLAGNGTVVLVAAGVSQLISNVPAAVLLSGFTGDYRELLYGVSVGGLGTLVASLASLISYKLYAREYAPGIYFRRFTLLNASLLIVLAAGCWLLVRMT
ncbi:SLC13 family permease [Gorillibacterium massiliense]|uniref:SLC13 family permease n=1 Tax=Gorillibacterium massiliense TaxID=1280390 RepID=UPI00138E5182|nr:SLC13 family permease [Gorillibacterium massiliense]